LLLLPLLILLFETIDNFFFSFVFFKDEVAVDCSLLINFFLLRLVFVVFFPVVSVSDFFEREKEREKDRYID